MTSLQQMEALEQANRVRMENARLRQELRALPRDEAAARAAELLRDYPPLLGALRVDQFLESVRGVGSSKAAQILYAAGVYRVGRRIRDLSPRQRELVAGQLVRWSDTVARRSAA